MLARRCLNLTSIWLTELLATVSTLALVAAHQNAFAEELNPESSVKSLQPGDILLVPLNCYVCNAIEKETGVPYSHSVVVANSSSELAAVNVYEAWGTTRTTPLLELIKRSEKGKSLFHMRAREFMEREGPSEKNLATVFEREFSRTAFDDEFLWDNFDERGVEKLYCAEFVVKFINSFLIRPMSPAPMHFGRLKDFWLKYYRQFNMDIPEGKPGVSPALIYSNDRLVKIGNFKAKEIEFLEHSSWAK